MFRPIYIIIAALSGCFASCSAISENDLNTKSSDNTQHNEVLSSHELVSVVTIRASQAFSHKNLKLSVIGIEDSRCPTGTACIWAGQMVVTLEISNELGEIREIKLVRKREPEIATAFGFNFLLLEVKPHPKKGKVIHLVDQIIELQIVQATQSKG